MEEINNNLNKQTETISHNKDIPLEEDDNAKLNLELEDDNAKLKEDDNAKLNSGLEDDRPEVTTELNTSTIRSLANQYLLSREEVSEITVRKIQAVIGRGYLQREINVVQHKDTIVTVIRDDQGEQHLMNLEDYPNNIYIEFTRSLKRDLLRAQASHEYEQFRGQEGNLMLGTVKHAHPSQNHVIISINGGKHTGILVHSRYYNTINYRIGQDIWCRLDKIEDNPTGSRFQLMFERSSVDFVKLLLANMIPDVENGLIEIVEVARIPGKKTKVSVRSDVLEPLGACIGRKGVVQRKISKELHNEDVEFVRWHPNYIERVKNYCGSVEVQDITILPHQSLRIVVNEDSVGLLRGIRDTNTKLLCKLLNCKSIYIMNHEEYKEEKKRNNETQVKLLINNGVVEEDAKYIMSHFTHWEYAILDHKSEYVISDESKDIISELVARYRSRKEQDFEYRGGDITLFAAYVANMFTMSEIDQFMALGLLSWNDFAKYTTMNELSNETRLDSEVVSTLFQMYQSHLR